MFPFGKDTSGPSNIMTDYDSQVVLATLTRHFLLSHLYVKRPKGNYVKLSQTLDRDGLMLLSRLPELIPAASVFEGGHFRIENAYTTIGRDDVYDLVEMPLASELIKDHELTTVFSATAEENIFDYDGPHLKTTGDFIISFTDEAKALNNFSEKALENIFAKKSKDLDKWLALKVKQFKKETGYNLPTGTLKLDDYYESTRKIYTIEWTENKTPPHILTAFYVFAGLN